MEDDNEDENVDDNDEARRHYLGELKRKAICALHYDEQARADCLSARQSDTHCHVWKEAEGKAEKYNAFNETLGTDVR